MADALKRRSEVNAPSRARPSEDHDTGRATATIYGRWRRKLDVKLILQSHSEPDECTGFASSPFPVLRDEHGTLAISSTSRVRRGKTIMGTRSIALLSCLVVFTSCDESLTSPTPTPGGTCLTNNTSQVSFQNQSRSTRHDIIWNNENIATLAPGTVTTQMTVQAGVAHRLEFRIANTTTLACQSMTPTLAACAEEAFSCALP